MITRALITFATVGAGSLFLCIGTPSVAYGAESSRTIEEVVVTARRREEALQSVPSAVSAVTSGELERSFYRNAEDLEGMAPNLVINPVNAGPQAAALSIRGISFADIEKSFDPAVGVLLDGIYIGTNTSQLFNVFDIERIEIARGPQGTLFGRNTIGGTINVIRPQPKLTGEVEGKAQVTVANYDRRDYNAAVYVPLVDDRLGLKVSGQTRRGGGSYMENVFTGDEWSGQDYATLLASLRFAATDALEFTYTYQWEDIDQTTPPSVNVSRPLIVPAAPVPVEVACVVFAQCQVDSDTPQQGDLELYAQNFPQQTKLDGDYHTLKAVWDLSADHELTALFGYRDQPELVAQDFDATALDLFHTIRTQDYEQTSYELQLNSGWTDDLTTTAGLFLWNSEYHLRQNTLHIFGNLPPGLVAFQDTVHETDSIAAYFQADYDLSDRWTLTLGGRWTEDEKKIDTTFGALTAGVGGSLVAPGTTVVDDDDWSEFTPKVGLRYQLNDDHMFYASYSTGFRSGGYNGRAASLTSLVPYDTEKVDNLEAGWRSTWLNDTVVFNATAFTSTYEDKQEEIVQAAPPPVFQETVVVNAAEADISGVELELLAQPLDGLSVRTNLGLLDAEYDSFPAGDPLDPTRTIDLSFLELRRAPEATFGAGAAYEWRAGGILWTLTADGRWKDDYETNARNVPEGHVDAHWIVDASLAGSYRGITLRLWGRNLTDEQFLSGALDVGAGISEGGSLLPGLWTFSGVSQPRTYGLELSVDSSLFR